MTDPNRIVCAAIRINSRIIICGARHYDQAMYSAINALDPAEVYSSANVEQGFIDTSGRFLSREEAFVAATYHNQIFRRVGGDGGRLFSENLY